MQYEQWFSRIAPEVGNDVSLVAVAIKVQRGGPCSQLRRDWPGA